MRDESFINYLPISPQSLYKIRDQLMYHKNLMNEI